MSGLHVKNATKRFGAFTAVDTVSLEVAPGEVLCLLGPSGCGKTTTLRMIAGLESTSDGAIYFDGKEVTRHAARDRNVAMAFQFYALYPNLTVGENLIYPLHSEGLRPEETEQKLKEISEVLHLSSVLHRYPHQLSEGEKQRVAVGRCVIRDPEVFLFDEPLSRLDVKLREEMRGDIRRILSHLDKPTVIVTHDQLEAMTMGDKIAVMRDGVIEQVGPQQEIFDYPANTFVAGFLGTPQMNLIEGKVSQTSSTSFWVKVGEKLLELSNHQWPISPTVGVKYTIGVRPRAIGFTQNGSSAVEGEVEMIEPMGGETLVHIRWDGVLLRMILAQSDAPDIGQKVGLSFETDALHLFDETGERISQIGEGGTPA